MDLSNHTFTTTFFSDESPRRLNNRSIAVIVTLSALTLMIIIMVYGNLLRHRLRDSPRERLVLFFKYFLK